MGRRDFVKLLSGSVCSMVIPFTSTTSAKSPLKPLDLPLPLHLQSILDAIVPLKMDPSGYLNLMTYVRGNAIPARVEVVPTRWNLEHNSIAYRMRTDQRLAIVLHWDGAPTGNQRSVEQLVRGLNESIHFVTRRHMSNSAHFGVGRAPISVGRSDPTSILSVAQLQHPWRDGTPLIASHVNWRVGKPDMLHDTPAQCLAVMRTLGLDTALRSVYEGVWLDPNYRTLAVEITGSRFDQDFPRGLPPAQVTANLLSLLLAISDYYSTGPWDVLGHQELQFDKPDPGKLYTGLVRYLLGIVALLHPASHLSELTFGGRLSHREALPRAQQYFSVLSEYVRRLVPTSDYQAWIDYTGTVALTEFLAKENATIYERKLFSGDGIRR